MAVDEVVPGDQRAILRKLAAIMKTCDFIAKDKSNEHFRYKYASEQAIKTALHAAMVEHGVIPKFDITAVTEREIPKKDKPSEWLTTAQMYYRFTDVDTGQYVEGTFFGAGVDGADKGVYKATTGAIKYILTSQFLIPTGDDPENDAGDKTSALKRSAAKVDTGGAPVGTKAASDAVKDRKVAEAAKPAPRPLIAPLTQEERFKMLDAFKGVKADLKKITGDDNAYYAVLGSAGYEKSDQLTTHAKATEVYESLRARYKEALAAKGVV